MDERVLWDTIMGAVSNSGTEDARSIRILLYMFFKTGEKFTFTDRLRLFKKLWRTLGVPTARDAPKALEGRPLFAFLFDTASNMNNLLPVFREAGRRGLEPTALTGDRVTLPPGEIEDLRPLATAKQIMAAAAVSERLAAWGLARKNFAKLCAEFDRLDPRMARTVRRIRTSVVAEMTLFNVASTGLRRLYSEWKPSFVVSTSDFWPFDYAVFAEARRASIPSCIVQHGIITGHFWWPFFADKLLLWGNSFEEQALRLGAPADRLAVCGMPAADHLFCARNDRGRRKSPGPAQTYLVLSNTNGQVHYPDAYTLYSAFLEAVVAARPEARWLIKLHPNEDQSFYRDMLGRRFKNFDILPKSTTLEEAFNQADVACTIWSTAGLEAMIKHLPLVVFDVQAEMREHAWWPQRGGGIYISSVEAMLGFIDTASVDADFLGNIVEAQDIFLKECFANHGCAAGAVVDYIRNSTDGSRQTDCR